MVTLDMVKGDMAEADEGREKETLAKEKKQKRRKNQDAAGCEDDKSFKTAKKKKDEVTKEGSLNTEKKKTMKKKRELEDQEEPSGKKQKKLKKNNGKSVQSKAEEEEVLATKKIISKKVKAQNPSEVINIDESEEEEEEEVVVMKKTTKKNKTGSKTSVTKTIASEEESQGVDQKAKKRKVHLEMDKDTLETVQKKKGKQEETKPTKGKKASSSVVVVEEDGPKPKKKKEIKGGKREVSLKVEVAQEVSVVDDKQQKSKKKKNAKVDKQTAVKDMAQNTETFVFVASDSKGKVKGGMKGAPEEIKRKAKKEVEVSVDKEEKKKRRKKIKLEEEAPQSPPKGTPHKDVVFLSEKTGNRDEVTINQERRLALQMDIDKGSHPPTKPLGFGQWGTAQFESTDKQQKFLRLMGGFKKEGNSASPSVPSGVQSNMALAGEKQQDLQQALLGEFERAQSRRVDFSARGAGLGFSSAPPSKKFSIDANASRSVRFDD